MNDAPTESPDMSPGATHKGWYRRGERHPPHFDAGPIPQFVTFRLSGSLPQVKLLQWKVQLQSGQIDDAELHRKIESYLDRGMGDCWLRNPGVTDMMQKALRHFDGQRYWLHGWVIMPNHVHVVFTPVAGNLLPNIVQSWKSFSAKSANKLLERHGTFWQEDYFDRYVRDLDHFERILWYVAQNPIVARLCEKPEDWPYSHVGAD